MAADEPWLLIGGGDADPNILRLLRAASARGVRSTAALLGSSGAPLISWEIGADGLMLDGLKIRPTAAFLREDVFGSDLGRKADVAHKSAVWHETLRGWLAERPDILWPNRQFAKSRQSNKLQNLQLALKAGFRIPKTLITNDVAEINERARAGKWVHKPVAGGAHCRSLGEIRSRTGILAYPMKLQERLENPEFRIFKIGPSHLAFEIVSDQLDHRQDNNSQIRPIAAEPNLCRQMNELCQMLGLDYAAIDFKTAPSSSEPVFLEINSNPMFSGFDQFARGQLIDTILDWLLS